MSTDRELLELAAKANWKTEIADEEVLFHYDEREEGILYLHADNQDHNGRDREFLWNPLTDDGDALRLAVKLHISVLSNIVRVEASTIQLALDRIYIHESTLSQGEGIATRRAIVRAAAEIGRSMP